MCSTISERTTAHQRQRPRKVLYFIYIAMQSVWIFTRCARLWLRRHLGLGGLPLGLVRLLLGRRLERPLVAIHVVEQFDRLLPLLVVEQLVLHAAPLEVVGRHDVAREDGLDHLLVVVEVFGKVVVEALFERVKLRARVVVVALELRQLHQVLELLLALAVILEAALDDKRLEVLVVGVGELEGGGRRDGLVLLEIFHLPVEHRLRGVESRRGEVEGDVGQRVGQHLDVGLDAAAVAHDAPVARGEGVGQRVGDMLRVASAPVAVVDGLDAASAGDVVFARGELDDAVVGQVEGRLHQSLAEGARAHDDGAVEVLEAAAGDLRGRGRLVVDEDDDGHHGVDRLHLGRKLAVGLLDLALHRQDGLALGHEHVDDGDGLLDASATVAPQVEDEALHALVLHVEHGAPHVAGAVLRVGGEAEIADAARLHAVVGHGRLLDLLAGDDLAEGLARRGAHDLDLERRSRVAAQVAGDVGRGLPRHRGVVDAHDDVALAQSRLGRRRVLIRLVDDHRLAHQVVADDGSDAAVASRQHQVELLGVVGGVVHRVGVEGVEHGPQAVAHHLVGVERIDIHHVEVFIDRVEHLQILRHVEVVTIVVLGVARR